MGWRGVAGTAVLACLLAAGPSVVGSGGPSVAAASVRPCSQGLVALTFDDGPSTEVTPKLLDVLTERRVPATFFMVGQRVASARSIALSAYKRGFVIANHTYGHELLTSLSDAAIRATLRRTTAALRDAGVRPSALMRPPYGAIDSRVSSVVKGMGLTPVLWDVDPRNWEPATPGDLAARVLSGLRPGSNVVLLHDGVARSATTLAAVPAIVTGARARGYCFAELGRSGRPVPPVPRLRVSDASVREGDPGAGGRLVFTLTLDRPTSRRVSVRVRTIGRSAVEGTDYRRWAGRVELPSGTTTRRLVVRVRGDRLDERRERLRVVLDEPRGLTVERRAGVGTIVDDDPRPRVRLSDAVVEEPVTGTDAAVVGITLDRASSRRVVLLVTSRPGEADETDYVPVEMRVVLPPGDRRTSVDVTVLADALDEPTESFELVVISAERAGVADGTATVTITPPPAEEPPEP